MGAKWWAHLVGALRVHPHNIEPTILRKKIEELRTLLPVGLAECPVRGRHRFPCFIRTAYRVAPDLLACRRIEAVLMFRGVAPVSVDPVPGDGGLLIGHHVKLAFSG